MHLIFIPVLSHQTQQSSQSQSFNSSNWEQSVFATSDLFLIFPLKLHKSQNKNTYVLKNEYFAEIHNISINASFTQGKTPNGFKICKKMKFVLQTNILQSYLLGVSFFISK